MEAGKDGLMVAWSEEVPSKQWRREIRQKTNHSMRQNYSIILNERGAERAEREEESRYGQQQSSSSSSSSSSAVAFALRFVVESESTGRRAGDI